MRNLHKPKNPGSRTTFLTYCRSRPSHHLQVSSDVTADALHTYQTKNNAINTAKENLMQSPPIKTER